MANLHLLESPTDPHAGGVLVEFPSGRRLQASWRHDKPLDVPATSKAIAAHLLNRLLETGATQDANATNWPSLVAAVQALIRQHESRIPVHN